MRKLSATLLYADLRGLTKATRDTTADGMEQLINSHLETMSHCIEALDGTIVGFGSDGLMVIFGAPQSQSDHALRALVCATEMQRQHDEWSLKRQSDEALTPAVAPGLGIGIGTGAVFAGDLGTPDQLRYTAIGEIGKLSAGLCRAAVGGQILIMPDVHTTAVSRHRTWSGGVALPRLSFDSLGPSRFKHVETPTQVISVRVKR